MVVINPLAGTRRRMILRQCKNTCCLVRIDVNHAAPAVDGRPAPFRAAKEAGKDYGLLIKADGQELAAAAESGKLFQRCCVRFRCPNRE